MMIDDKLGLHTKLCSAPMSSLGVVSVMRDLREQRRKDVTVRKDFETAFELRGKKK